MKNLILLQVIFVLLIVSVLTQTDRSTNKMTAKPSVGDG